MRRIAQFSLTVIISISMFAACANREVARVDPTQSKENFKDIPVELNRDIDLVFVIDNSGSMNEEQLSLAANFNRFINVLENIEGGLPNVRIGVVSTDTGAGPNNGGTGCSANGDNGGLRTNPACGVSNAFIEDIEGANGTRMTNYTGNLSDTFSCLATLGINGCGFEQPLESIKRALDGSNPANNNFLRENAFLAIIIVSDEDDCSVYNSTMFDTTQNDPNAPLGALSSFRCFEFGVQCEPDDPRTPGPRQNCVPRDDSNYMTPVMEYVDFVKSLKEDTSQIIVGGIIGNPTPVSVGVDVENNNIPKLVPSCVSASGEAAPSTRLKFFLDQFPQRNTVTTICNENLEDALVVIAELLRKVIGNPCMDGDIDTDPNTPGVQYDCQVSDVRFPDTEEETQTIIEECNGSGRLPCWELVENRMQCPESDSGMELVINREGDNVPSGTHVQARCVVL